MFLKMRLNKRYKRNIKLNIIFYVAASLLTMLCVMAFALLFTCGRGIIEYSENMFEECVVEDANVQTLLSIDNDDLNELQEKYHILIEKQESIRVIDTKTFDDNGKDVTVEGTKATVFKHNTKLNKYKITEQKEGYDLKDNVNNLKDNEIIINEKYANRHNISLKNDNAKIVLEGKEFKIVGYFVRPDYLYGLEDVTSSYPNYDSNFIAYVNDASFDSFMNITGGDISSSAIYSIKYNQGGETDIDILRDELFTSYITVQYNSASTSGRLKIFHTRPQMYVSFSFLSLAIMPFAVVLLIAIILNIKVKNDQKIIGTIEALGYRESEICFHYSIMAMIPGIIGGILMTVIIYITEGMFGKLATGDFEVMHINFLYPWYTAILGILIPTLIYVVASILTVKKLINKPVTSLLRGAGKESKSSKFLVNKRSRITFKYALRSLLINKGRTFVVFLGIMASTLIITIALSMFDTIDAIVSQAMKKAGDFEYEYTLKLPEITDDTTNKTDYNYIIGTIYESNDRKIPLMGADADNINLWYTTLTDGTKITKLDNDSFYMSKLCAELMHVSVGDTVTIESNFNKEKLTFKLTGIIDNGLLSYILTSKANVIDSYFKTLRGLVDENTLKETLDPETYTLIERFFNEGKNIEGLDKLYNIVLSTKKIDTIGTDDVINIFQKSSIETQKDAKLKERTPIIYTVLIIGILICVIAVFTVVNVIVEDNQGNISMLMVLGYKPSEINRMIIDGNHILVPLGLAIGMPLAYLILRIYFKTTIPNNNMIMPVTISVKTVFIIIAIIVSTYFLTLEILKAKARRVSMTDSLKDNR